MTKLIMHQAAKGREHGSPFDRGGADFWYNRPQRPHYWPDGTGFGDRVTEDKMTKEQVKEYLTGFNQAMDAGDQKEWD